MYLPSREFTLKAGDRVEISSGMLHQITALYESAIKITFRQVGNV